MEAGRSVQRLQQVRNHLGPRSPPPGPALLKMERDRCTFSVRSLIHLLNGGEDITARKEEAAQLIERDAILRDDISPHDMSREQLKARCMAKIKRLHDLDLGEPQMQAVMQVMNMYDPSLSMRLGVHTVLFIPTILNQGTEEQKKMFADDARAMKIIGCFAMTELGNGSYIQNFETTATYSQATQEFVIHSPSITSIKWWMGLAGETATHGVVYARLIIENNDHGVHIFVVPLRDRKTGHLLPGVQIGDVGSKMGRNGIDNGWIKFDSVKVPRENMLARWAQVSPEGEYTKPPLPQLAYGALIGGRVVMTRGSAEVTGLALTIAVRYGAVRVHHGNKQILDYQSHQFRLIPMLAETFAIHFTSGILMEKYAIIQKELNDMNLESLPEFHSLSAGLKSFNTWFCLNSVEICRQSCGGHGYSAYVELAQIFSDFAVLVSGEGDNTVMAQQCARYLMSALKKPKSESVKYLAEEILSVPVTATNLLDPHIQTQLCKYIAGSLIRKTAKRLSATSWNDCMVDLVHCAKCHCYLFMATSFIQIVKHTEDKPIKDVLKQLCDLFILNWIEQQSAILLEDNCVPGKAITAMREEIRNLCLQLRPNVVSLVDSFNIPDFILRSPLGQKDGDVYVHYLETVKKAQQHANGMATKAPYWDELIKPLVGIER